MEGIGGVIKRRAEQPKKKPESGKAHLPGIEIPEIKTEKYIHSPEHALAAEISAHFHERERFSAYLSIINRIGIAQARTAFASIKSGEANVQNPRKFFSWLAKYSDEERGAAKMRLVEKRAAKAEARRMEGKQMSLIKLAKKTKKS